MSMRPLMIVDTGQDPYETVCLVESFPGLIKSIINLCLCHMTHPYCGRWDASGCNFDLVWEDCSSDCSALQFSGSHCKVTCSAVRSVSPHVIDLQPAGYQHKERLRYKYFIESLRGPEQERNMVICWLFNIAETRTTLIRFLVLCFTFVFIFSAATNTTSEFGKKISFTQL